MKLRYIFVALIAVLTLAVGCQKETIKEQWDEIQLSQTYVAIPMVGGTQTITITAEDSWSIDEKTVPSWLTITPMSGAAGESQINFTGKPVTAGTGEVSITINCGGKKQLVNVLQGLNAAEASTCAQVIAGPNSKRYRVTGTVTSIINTTYGNFYLQDATGEIYIYGTLDASGNAKQWAKFGIELGDVVTVEGPKATYGSVVELVDATFISIKKALLKVATPAATLEKESGELVVKVAYKGNGAFFTIPEEYKSWISYSDMEYVAGVPTKIVSNPADTAVVKFNVAANEGGDRDGKIIFKSASGSTSSSVTYTFTQKGAIIDATSADIIAAPDGTVQYRYTGYITRVENTTYGNCYVADAFGSIYIYGVTDAAGKTKVWSSLGVNAGDIITLVGPKSTSKDLAQLSKAKYESHISVKDIDIVDFLALSDSKDYYRLEGTVSGITSTDVYGNFNITDATGTVYVHGLLSGWGGASKQFQTLVAAQGLKDGDTICIVGCRSSYKGTAQVGSAFFVRK